MRTPWLLDIFTRSSEIAAMREACSLHGVPAWIAECVATHSPALTGPSTAGIVVASIVLAVLVLALLAGPLDFWLWSRKPASGAAFLSPAARIRFMFQSSRLALFYAVGAITCAATLAVLFEVVFFK